MSFQEPALLWFALLLIVPLVLYLLPLPRRRIAASALYLWQRFLRAEPFGQASERFRRALGFALLAAILASLILAAASLTVGNTSVKARHVVVLVDVSASMNALVDGKTNLSRAKDAAAQLIESLDAGTEVAVVEAAGELQVLRPLSPGLRQAAAKARRIEPCDGPCDMRRALAEAWSFWGGRSSIEIFVYTDNELPQSPWGTRAHAWIAPSVGDEGNVGIVAISAERSSSGPAGNAAGPGARPTGREITVTFTLASYGSARRMLSGVVIANGRTRGSFGSLALDCGQSVQHSVRFDEPGAAEIQVNLERNRDALAADDNAWIAVPALDDMRVGVLWPLTLPSPPGGEGGVRGRRRNDYVAAVLSALQDEGVIGPVEELPEELPGTRSRFPNDRKSGHVPGNDRKSGHVPGNDRKSGHVPGSVPVTVYVNQLPAAWPEGGAIVLYPLRSGVIEVAGLHAEPLTVARQAQDRLLAGVDLRGLPVKGAVQAAVPEWATPLVWADNNLPLVWAGVSPSPAREGAGEGAGSTKVLFVGIPVMPSGSRLPLVASFPVLMRNALQWMLPSPESPHPGEREGGWTSRKAGLVKCPDGRVRAFSVASTEESDLRRAPGLKGETFGQRHSLATILVMIAIALLLIEWGLFHRRMTE